MGRKMTIDEVADYFRTSPRTVRYWRVIGYGPQGVRIGRRVLYDEDDVKAFEQECRAAEAAERAVVDR